LTNPAAAASPTTPAETPVPNLREDQAQLLTRALNESASHGFSPGEFAAADISALLASQDPAARQRGEALLRKSIVAYARAQHGARLPAADFHDDWGIRPEPYDAAADFNFALKQDKLAQWLADLPPPFERYRALRTALVQYQAIAARGGWGRIADGPALKPGMSDPRVVQLRRRLAAENRPGSIELTSPVYDPQFAAVVAAAQARYGLNPDSVVAAGTLKAFNIPVEVRIAQIAANMERWRWMPRAWPSTRIEVNIAGAELVVYDENKPVLQMKTVVGARDKKTPMLRSEIHSVVFNPPWNVPSSIVAKELAPKGEAYLVRKGFAWVSNGAGGQRLQQKPGPGNSLGRIKFDFNNPYGVYLHDTDAKTAFGRDARSISHGCVRVEKPQELANLVLGADPAWSPARLTELLADSTTVRKPLAQKIPVLLLYWTVFVAPDGQVNFRDDQYDWDDDLSKSINSGKIAA
jgi:murein L,D-transpeptidase YcbB/YkuD